jgi:hypothetical protein
MSRYIRNILPVAVALSLAACGVKNDPRRTLDYYLQACTTSAKDKAAEVSLGGYMPIVYSYKILRDDGASEEHGDVTAISGVVAEDLRTQANGVRPEQYEENWQAARRAFIHAHPLFSDVYFTVAGGKMFAPPALTRGGAYSIETHRFVVDLDRQNISSRSRESAREVYTLARVSFSTTEPTKAGWFIAHSGNVGDKP